MTSKQYLGWIHKINKAKVHPSRRFALQMALTTIKYLQEKKFTVNDFDKVFDNFTKVS